MGRIATKSEKASALEKALKSMFGALQSRPVPDRLRSVVDQLDEGDETPPQKQKRA